MKYSKRHLISLFIVVLAAYFLAAYKLPFYIYKPGMADPLNPVVSVEGGYESAGDMHLVTVSGGQATPVQYVWAKFLPHHEVLPLKEVRPKGVSEDEYMHAQLQLMESSQEASTVVAYEAADADININYEGVFVAGVVENMPADGILEMGDQISRVDGRKVKRAEELISFVDKKKAGDKITLELERDGEQLSRTIMLEAFPRGENKVGVGIQLVTKRSVHVDPEVHFSSGNIGGPSAGLMFSLEIYDQLTEEDLTHGYEIAGTGEIDYDGNVRRIGGIDKKVIAADRDGCDIFFAPNENGAADSNYAIAKATAAEIGTDMKIVPVDTFQDALQYLKRLGPGK